MKVSCFERKRGRGRGRRRQLAVKKEEGKGRAKKERELEFVVGWLSFDGFRLEGKGPSKQLGSMVGTSQPGMKKHFWN